MVSASNWFFWALMSAVFAALTAIFAKVGLEGVDSDLATLVRTFVIMAVLIVFVHVTRKWSNPFELSSRTWLFLMLSGLATGASWVCYFRALKIGEVAKVGAASAVRRDGFWCGLAVAQGTTTCLSNWPTSQPLSEQLVTHENNMI